MSSMEELRANEVKWTSVPPRTLGAAEAGQGLVLRKIFPAARPRHSGWPTIRFFDGEPTQHLKGCYFDIDPDSIWVSIALGDLAETCAVSAHESVHSVSIASEQTASTIGRLAARYWTGQAELFVHHGWPAPDFRPEDARLSSKAVLLVIENGAHMYVNDGTTRDIRWRRVSAIA